MRELGDCKAYFQDVYLDALDDPTPVETTRYRTLYDVLDWIYEDAFRCIEATWRQEALNEYCHGLQTTTTNNKNA